MHALVNAHIITDNTKLMNDIDVNFFFDVCFDFLALDLV